MKKSEMKAIVREAIESRGLCGVYFRYDFCKWYCYPLKVGEKLFLAATEDDFIFDGYSIRRFVDLVEVETKNNKWAEIHVAEGLVDSLIVPDVDVTDWRTAFESLQAIGENVIVEHESQDEDENEFYIGRIEKVLKNSVRFRHFDADGIWQEPQDIPFSHITSVTFASRYVTVFSRHLHSPGE